LIVDDSNGKTAIVIELVVAVDWQYVTVVESGAKAKVKLKRLVGCGSMMTALEDHSHATTVATLSIRVALGWIPGKVQLRILS